MTEEDAIKDFTSERKFRIQALEDHLWIELQMNKFLTKYFRKRYDGDPSFHDLILRKLGFEEKTQIINKILRKKIYYQRLPELLSNVTIKDNKVIITAKNGEVLSISKLNHALEKLNEIRNHLMHTPIILDIDKEKQFNLESFRKTPVDMNCKGDLNELREASTFASNFFANLKYVNIP